MKRITILALAVFLLAAHSSWAYYQEDEAYSEGLFGIVLGIAAAPLNFAGEIAGQNDCGYQYAPQRRVIRRPAKKAPKKIARKAEPPPKEERIVVYVQECPDTDRGRSGGRGKPAARNPNDEDVVCIPLDKLGKATYSVPARSADLRRRSQSASRGRVGRRVTATVPSEQNKQKIVICVKDSPRRSECPCPRCRERCPCQRCPGERVCAGCPGERGCPRCRRDCVCPRCPRAPVCPRCPQAQPCPRCPEPEVCPKCPEPQPCPECPECPECKECPKCPEPKVCPKCPEPQPCPECPECPKCPEFKPCPKCPECPKFPECKECPKCPNPAKSRRPKTKCWGYPGWSPCYSPYRR